MTCQETQGRLSDLLDDALSETDLLTVRAHLEQCNSCTREFDLLTSLRSATVNLPKSIAPQRDLWSGIQSRLALRFGNDEPAQAPRGGKRASVYTIGDRERRSTPVIGQRGLSHWRKNVFAIAATVLIAVGTFWYTVQSTAPVWNVARLDGNPRLGSERMAGSGKLRVGEWIETDAASRARIDVGMIGQVEIDPNTRVRLVEARLTDHRIALARGTIHATIWAPPRLFFVETPSATAIDLGCAYTLTVDDKGGSILHVTSGWVALDLAGRESIIPAGALCVTKPGVGPGTPFAEDVPDQFRDALARLDFENGGDASLMTILASARREDALTLWHLLTRTTGHDRGKVYDRLASLSPPPEGVTREGVLNGNRKMIDGWANELGFGGSFWWDVL